MNNYQRLQWIRGVTELNLEPYQVTKESVTNTLKVFMEGDVQDVGSFVNSELENNKDKQLNSVNSVVFSPDGQTIALGSTDKTVKLWSRQGKLLNTLNGHNDSVISVMFSPDGQTIASGSGDKTVKLWSRDGRLLNTLKGHDVYVRSVVFSPDGQTIASGSEDKTIKLWNNWN